MPYKQEFPDHYIIYTDEGSKKLPKGILSQAQQSVVDTMPDISDVGGAAGPPPAPRNVVDDLSIPGPEELESLGGIGAGVPPAPAPRPVAPVAPMVAPPPQMAAVTPQLSQEPVTPAPMSGLAGLRDVAARQRAFDPSVEQLPPLDIAKVRREAGAYPEGEEDPIYKSETARIQSLQRAEEYETREAEKKWKLDLAAQQEKIQEREDDVRSYKVDPGYFWSGRKVKKKKAPQAPPEEFTQGGVTVREVPEEQEDEYETVGGKSTGEKIGLVIAAALMARGSAKLGGDGTAGMRMIDRMIDRDMRAQEIELEKRKGLAQEQVNYLGEMRDIHKDEQAARLRAEAGLRQSLETEFARIDKRVGDTLMQRRSDELRQDNLRKGKQSKEMSLAREGATWSSIAAYEQRDAQAQAKAKAAAEKRRREDALTGGLSWAGEARVSQKRIELIYNRQSATKSLVSNIDEALEISKNPGVLIPGSTARKEYTASLADILSTYKGDDFKKMGASFSESEQKMMKQIIGEIEGGRYELLTKQNVMLLERLARRLKIKYNNYIKANGMEDTTWESIKPSASELGEQLGERSSR